MFFSNKFLIFLPSLMLGTIISISSSSWLSAWMGLEINLMSMAPLLINKMSYQSVESSIKYFLIQAMASTILIFFSMLSSSSNNFAMLEGMELIFISSLMLKAGVAPLHFWFPQVMIYSDWFQCLILLTWQKMAPLLLVSYLVNHLLSFFILSSAFTGILGAINQTNLKLIMTYSSIIHSSWMLAMMPVNELMWWLYFSMYFFITLSVSFLPSVLKINNISYFKMIPTHINLKILMLINFFSLAGLPPFLGFFIKLLALNCMMVNNTSPLVVATLILSSAISFYFYSRIMLTSIFINNNFNAMSYSLNINLISKANYMILLHVISITGNIIMPLLMMFC